MNSRGARGSLQNLWTEAGVHVRDVHRNLVDEPPAAMPVAPRVAAAPGPGAPGRRATMKASDFKVSAQAVDSFTVANGRKGCARPIRESQTGKISRQASAALHEATLVVVHRVPIPG